MGCLCFPNQEGMNSYLLVDLVLGHRVLKAGLAALAASLEFGPHDPQ